MPAEKWAELYDRKGRYNSGTADFSRYIIGTAWELPVADQSIDFVFSSHVFEHLANPIGHLVQWQRKLRSKGKVIAVVPDARATKDYLMPPCSLDELLDEQARGITAPESRHYQRYGMARRSTRLAAASEAEKASIHVHFYVPDSMARLLRHCVQEHGFSDYSIVQSRNHKDFYFVLEAR
jgi:ubiquinone/menaquinone biosynthesis C-methylase UbiE